MYFLIRRSASSSSASSSSLRTAASCKLAQQAQAQAQQPEPQPKPQKSINRFAVTPPSGQPANRDAFRSIQSSDWDSVAAKSNRKNNPPTSNNEKNESREKSEPGRPFHEIPGPRAIPLLGNLWRYLPVIGNYRVDALDANGRYNLRRYGEIVREEISASHRIVHLFDARDIEDWFTDREDRFPYRRSHRALLRYRRERPAIYRSGGIFPENGPEWARLRDLFKRPLLTARFVNAYDATLDTISNDLCRLIREKRHPATCEMSDFQQDMYRWALESICAIMLDTRMGCLTASLSSSSEPAQLIAAAHETIDAVMRTELYDDWERPPGSVDYRRLERAQDIMAQICARHFNRRIDEILNATTTAKTDAETADDDNGNSTDQTILERLIRSSSIDRRDHFALILDCVLAGIDTTSISATFALYYLARNQDIQDRLRSQITATIGMNGADAHHRDSITAADLSRIPLLRAVIKETLRLRPVSIGVGRLTTCPVTLGGFRIPAGTMLITQNQVSCQRAKYFPDPHRFAPDRWLESQSLCGNNNNNNQNNQENNNNNNNCGNENNRGGGGRPRRAAASPPARFVWLPFGHGPRMCLGRRIAELEMQIVIAKLVAQFRVEYEEEEEEQEEIGVKTMLINVPDRPVRLRFHDLRSTATTTTTTT